MITLDGFAYSTLVKAADSLTHDLIVSVKTRFPQLNHSQVANLICRVKKEEHIMGSKLIEFGKIPKQMFIIKSGMATVYSKIVPKKEDCNNKFSEGVSHKKTTTKVPISILQVGACFGDREIIQSIPSNFEVYASSEKIKLYILEAEDLLQSCRFNNAIEKRYTENSGASINFRKTRLQLYIKKHLADYKKKNNLFVEEEKISRSSSNRYTSDKNLKFSRNTLASAIGIKKKLIKEQKKFQFKSYEKDLDHEKGRFWVSSKRRFKVRVPPQGNQNENPSSPEKVILRRIMSRVSSARMDSSSSPPTSPKSSNARFSRSSRNIHMINRPSRPTSPYLLARKSGSRSNMLSLPKWKVGVEKQDRRVLKVCNLQLNV